MKEPVLATILRYFVYAVAFVPLIIFSDYMSPFHFGKVIVFRSLIEVMLVFYLLLIWKDRSYLPKMNIVSWAFLFFTLAFTLATITSVLPYSSTWGSLERMGGLVTFWHYFAYFIILIAVMRTEKNWLNLFNLVIFIGVLSAFYGFLQRTDISWVVGSGGRSRIFGTVGNPALFAGYQILVLFLSAMLFFRPASPGLQRGEPGISRNWQLFYALSALIMTIAAFMTAVRGSILAIAVGFLAFALLYTSAYRSKLAKKALLGLVGFLVLFVGAAMLFKDSSFVQNSGYLRRLTDFSPQAYTVQTRFWAWQAGFKGWEETPKTILVGWGPENFNIPFSKNFNPKFYAGPGAETLFDRAHNMFVEILVTMGLVGLLTYVWIFGASIKVLWKNIHRKETMVYGVGLIPLLIAYVIHNSFIFDTSANFIVFFTILGFISFLAKPLEHGQKMPMHKPAKVNGPLWALSAIALFIFVMVVIYKVNILPAKANYTTTRAIVISWHSDFAGAVKKYQEAMAYDVPGKYEIRHRFAQYILEKTNSAQLTPEYIEAIKLAIAEVNKNIEENKIDYLPYLYVSRLYIVLGKSDPNSEYNDKSLEMSMAALKLSPTFVRTYYEIGQVYLNKRDYDKASEYFKKAAELNPEVGLSQWYHGVVEIERGNISLGLSIVEEIIQSGQYTPSEGDMGRLVNIYIRNNDYKKLAWAYTVLIKISPSNPQHHASLAVALANLGLIDDAVREAKEAAKLDKAYESEARSFVQSLGRAW